MLSARPPRDPYWDRIGYRGPLEPTLDVLREICRRHVLEVPFEALEGPEGRRPVIDRTGVYDKIVTRRGGGFCLQANGLLSHLLREIGFDVTVLAAHIWLPHREYFSKGGDHLILMVRIDGTEWLVDASYTHLVYVEPIEFVPGEQRQDGWAYRIGSADGWYVVYRRGEREWLPLYRFVPEPLDVAHFQEAVAFHLDGETVSETTRTLMCSRGIRGGKVSLVNNVLTVAERGTVTTRLVRDPGDCARVMARIFRGHRDLAERGLRIWRQLQQEEPDSGEPVAVPPPHTSAQDAGRQPEQPTEDSR
ncbi:arylamine N-acetyltransferase family protein [Streptomyces shenzhenensis]